MKNVSSASTISSTSTTTTTRPLPFLLCSLLLLLATMTTPVVESFSIIPTTKSSTSTTRCQASRHNEQDLGRQDRREWALDTLKKASFLTMAWTTAATTIMPNNANAAGKKLINLEEARERGEKKMEEIEKAKGPLIKVGNGEVKYREELVGKGDTFEKGDLLKIRYQVYKGNGDYMFSLGYGREVGYGAQNDVGETYDFTYLRPNSIPRAVEIGMEGMRVGGKRKISVRPELGFTTSGGFPEPTTFSGKRKLMNNIDQLTQFEVELIRVKKRGGKGAVKKEEEKEEQVEKEKSSAM